VALASQLQDRQRRTHAAVAEAIEHANAGRLEGSAALLAHHWEEAGYGPTAAGWHAMAAASSGLNDVGAALDHWRRTRALAGPEQTELAANASSQILALGWREGASEDECEQVFEEASALAERAGDLRSLAALTANYGGYRGITLGATRDYIRYVGDSVRLADETGDLDLRCGTRAYLVYAYYHGGLLEPCLAACDELEPLLEGDPHRGADVAGFSPLIAVDHARWAQKARRGDPVDLRAPSAFRQAALDHGYPEMVVWVRFDQIALAVLRGEDGASRWARESLELAENLGALSDVVSNLSLARALGFDGDAKAKLATAAGALRTIRDDGYATYAEPHALQLIAEAHLALEQLAEARDSAAEACALLGERATYSYALSSYGSLARAQLALEEPSSEVERTLDEYAAALQYTGARLYELELAELRALLRAGAH